MTAEPVLRLKHPAPFQPFEMFLADGRVLQVPHPDFLTVAEDEELVHLYDMDEGVETIDLLMVVSVRFPPRNVPAITP